ncbi:hypothetical protein K435DRAFT_497336 [Dendrothele bispora CBS 962.96]|uniref:Uncharacterized protein n=1 Tax=Dendrothele bispora (strain CBS 962.96) TaxID=1314807 RepID=A0A4S8KY19_DENBC|nr:hypothetical protein K435DRAFT_497336 [Dendrothele bispora CBS 962.96]
MEAYDIKDDPIHPDEYPKLRGATVLCSISISRWEIEEEIEGEIERGYTFSPHIVQLRVLLPSRPFGTKPETPKKRLGIDSGGPLKKRSRRE